MPTMAMSVLGVLGLVLAVIGSPLQPPRPACVAPLPARGAAASPRRATDGRRAVSSPVIPSRRRGTRRACATVGKRNRSVRPTGAPVSARRAGGAPARRAASGRRGRRSCRRARRGRRPSTFAPDLGDRAPRCSLPAGGADGSASARERPRRPGSALRSILPFGVSGNASSSTTCGRHHEVGQRAREVLAQGRRRSAPAPSVRSRRRRPAACRRPVFARDRRPPSRTAGWRVAVPPRSRPARCGEPRILTWWSSRPRNSSVPSARQRTRSPVRYRRAPGLGERIGHEALGGQLGAVEVAARTPSPPMYSSPETPTGTGCTVGVEHVERRVRDRPADRDRASLGGRVERVGERPDRRLGRARTC